MKLLIAAFLVFYGQAFAGEDPSTRHISKDPVSQLELQILEHGDAYSAGSVLGRLEVLHKEKGVDAVRPAIPAMKARLEKLQAKEGNTSLEADLVIFLGQLGDTTLGSKELFLKAVRRGNRLAAFGLVNFDSAIDSVTAYLQDSDSKIRRTASQALVQMYRRKPDIFGPAQMDLVRTTLVKNLSLYDFKGSELFALGTFGNSDTIPILKEIAENDPYTGLRGRHSNRYFAKWAISQINR